MTEDETEAESQAGSQEQRDVSLEAKVQYPVVPTDENPEDGEALRLIVTGQNGQRNLYDTLALSLESESAFLIRMLRRDWEKRFPALIVEGRQLLAISRGVEEDQLDEIVECPSLDEIKSLCKTVNGRPPEELLQFLGDFARRCLVCGRLLPWKAEAARVFKFFADCVEAEDHHVELVAQLTDLVD